ncbi:MAG: dihydrodipicolinate synthase family protein [Cyclobacteriaceae bacterium]|nr:dihydrodipicolinate synthase family protein [Cyclobacteriaceae bacterium]
MAEIWHGVYPAITSKFTEEDEIDLVAFEKNLQAQVLAGIDGIIIGGSLGEASTLSETEKFSLMDFTVNHSGTKIKVILNIAEQSTKVAAKQAERAEKSGAAGLMVLPPMRYKADDRETVTFFKEIARATSLPVMIYNNPIDYKINVTPDMFEELSGQANITAIKDSSRDTTNITRMINRFGSRYKILCGVDTLAFESLLLGADGWVAGLVCAFPKETVAIYRLIRANRIQEARKIFRWFLPLLELDIHPKLVQYIKLAESVTGLGTERVRPPRLPLEGKERERILSIIEKGIQSRPELPLIE